MINLKLSNLNPHYVFITETVTRYAVPIKGVRANTFVVKTPNQEIVQWKYLSYYLGVL